MQLASYLGRFDKNQFKSVSSGLGAPIVLLAIMGMVILPMPAFLLDILFSFNIALSLVIILVSVLTKKPVDFGIFPLVLLIATVLRLALNVASTRIVLLEGHEGGDAAGKVIQAFGEVVIGGNYAVGIVVFCHFADY
jgi:flagellar biosynthesis protein FlhA